MDDYGPGSHCSQMRRIDVRNSEPELCTLRWSVALRLVEREVEEGPVSPRNRSVPSTYPAVAFLVVIRGVEIESEAVLVETRRAVEVSNLDHDSNETVLLNHGSERSYPRGSPRPRVAMMLRWISLLPAAIVAGTVLM